MLISKFIMAVRKVRGGAFMVSRPSSRFWSPSVLSWRAWFLRTSTGSTHKKSLPAGSYSPYSLQPWLLYSTASVSDRVIKIAQQTKLNHRHLHVKVSLQKCSWSSWVMYQLINELLFLVCLLLIFFFEHKIVRRFYSWRFGFISECQCVGL